MMLALPQGCRAAVPDDAQALAELINFAGEGLPLYLWGRMAEPGETAWEVGQRRARRDVGGFSWRNATVSEQRGSVAACLIGYTLPNAPEPLDLAQTPPMFVPLEELERLAPGSWYVNVLATYPDHRGGGLGTVLLGLADQLAAAAGRRGSSIIVATPMLAPAASTSAAAMARSRAGRWSRTAGPDRRILGPLGQVASPCVAAKALLVEILLMPPSPAQWVRLLDVLEEGGRVYLCSFGRAHHAAHGFRLPTASSAPEWWRSWSRGCDC